MNRYIVFAYDAYYPGGGSEDIKGVFPDTRSGRLRARALEKVLKEGTAGRRYDYTELYDVKENRII